jgi:BON domain
MRRFTVLTVACVAIGLMSASSAVAQFNQGGFGLSTGNSGSAGTGFNNAGGMNAGSMQASRGTSAFGSSGMSGMSSRGTFGNRSLGGSVGNRQGNFGSGGPNQTAQIGQMAFGSTNFMQARQQGAFVGANGGGGGADSFFGTLGLLGAASNASQRNMGIGQQRGQGRNQQGQNNQNGNGRNNQAQQPRVRTVLRLGFEAPLPSARGTSTTLARRLANSRALEVQSPITVETQGRTVVLRGAVANDHARVLAAQLAHLEPGVAEVKNELTVVEPAPSAARQPSSSSATAAPQRRNGQGR